MTFIGVVPLPLKREREKKHTHLCACVYTYIYDEGKFFDFIANTNDQKISLFQSNIDEL